MKAWNKKSVKGVKMRGQNHAMFMRRRKGTGNGNGNGANKTVNISAASTTSDGKIELEFDDDLNITPEAYEFTVTIDGATRTITSIEIVAAWMLRLVLDVPTTGSDSNILVSYSSIDPNINLINFTDYPVMNTQAAPNPQLDIDGDGKPDTVVYDDHGIMVTEDDDSYNVDIDGDGVADFTVPK